MSQFTSPRPDTNLNVTAAAVTPTDRVRWGPIIAGLAAALSTLVVLAVLGAAVAGSAFDPGDSMRSYGVGAGIWGVISALIAFFVGGWLAGRSAAVRGHGAGLLNGAMVWVATIPLMMIVGSMIASRAASAVGTAAQTSALAANAASNQMTGDQAQTASARIGSTTQQVTGQAQQAAQQITKPENQEKAADATAKGAWYTLIGMLLSLAAAGVGGHIGNNNTTRTHRAADTDDATRRP